MTLNVESFMVNVMTTCWIVADDVCRVDSILILWKLKPRLCDRADRADGRLLGRDGASIASLDRDRSRRRVLDPDPSKPAFSRETLHSNTKGGERRPRGEA